MASHPVYHDRSHMDDKWITEHVQSTKAGNSEAFPRKLHCMLERVASAGHASIVRWLSHGRAFKVYDKKRFEAEVLPTYFQNQGGFLSFQRQLNLYGFLRLTGRGRDQNAYYHELLLRGRPKLCALIHRKSASCCSVRRTFDPETEPDFYGMLPLPEIDINHSSWTKSCTKENQNLMSNDHHGGLHQYDRHSVVHVKDIPGQGDKPTFVCTNVEAAQPTHKLFHDRIPVASRDWESHRNELTDMRERKRSKLAIHAVQDDNTLNCSPHNFSSLMKSTLLEIPCSEFSVGDLDTSTVSQRRDGHIAVGMNDMARSAKRKLASLEEYFDCVDTTKAGVYRSLPNLLMTLYGPARRAVNEKKHIPANHDDVPELSESLEEISYELCPEYDNGVDTFDWLNTVDAESFW